MDMSILAIGLSIWLIYIANTEKMFLTAPKYFETVAVKKRVESNDWLDKQ